MAERTEGQIKGPADLAVQHPAHSRLRQESEGRKNSDSIKSVDFETAISKSGFGKFNVMLLVLAIPATSCGSFVTNSMSYVMPSASADLNLTATDKAMLQSAAYVGMICGGLILGSVSDSFGRKNLLAACFLMDFLMNTLTGLSSTLPAILLFKCLSGFMVSGPTTIFTAYISEVFKGSLRDFTILSTGFFGALCNISQAGLAMLVIPSTLPNYIPIKPWQLFQMLCGVPSLICGLVFLFCLESPKYLMDNGRREEALKVCQTIYTINTGKDPKTYPVRRLHQSIAIEDKRKGWSKISEVVDIFKTPFIQQAVLSFIIQFGHSSSNNGIGLWLPEMLSLVQSSSLNNDLGLCPLVAEGHSAKGNSTSQVASGSPDVSVYMDMIMVYAGTLVGHLMFVVAAKYFGKKTMAIGCALTNSLFALAIPLMRADYSFIPSSAYISVNSMVYQCNIAVTVSAFPTRLRASSVSLTLTVGRVGILVSNFIIAKYIYSYCQYFFYVLAANGLVMALAASFQSEEPLSIKNPQPRT